MIVAVVLVVLGAGARLVARWDFMVDRVPTDFQLNWVAAHRLVDREPLYDQAAAREEGLRRIGPSVEPIFSSGAPYSGFIGTPATALLHVPFAPFAPDTATALYRITAAALMVAAVVVTGLALPRRSRPVAWLVGVVALALSWPAQASIALGQVDGFVMISLAVGLWATSRERWRLAGAAFGVAALLKITPGLLILYLLLRGFARVVLPALATVAALLAVAMVVGRPGDLFTWVRDVAPEVSRGGLLVNNQSIPAWLARLFGHNADWISLSETIGAWRFVAPLVVIAGFAALLALRHRRRLVVLELGAVLLVGLLAGPVSWDHYSSWAILVLVLGADRTRWAGRRCGEIAVAGVALAVAAVLMHKGTGFTPSAGGIPLSTRLDSGSKTVALLLGLGVALWLLVPRPSEPADEDVVPDGDSLPAGAYPGTDGPG